MNVILRNQKRMMWATGMNFSASKHKKRYEQTTALPFWKNDSNTQPVTSLHTTARPPSISYVFSPETRGLSTSNSLTHASPQLGPNALGAGSRGEASKHRTCTGIRRLWTICTVAPWHNSSVHCDNTSVTKCPAWHIASLQHGKQVLNLNLHIHRRLGQSSQKWFGSLRWRLSAAGAAEALRFYLRCLAVEAIIASNPTWHSSRIWHSVEFVWE